MGAVCRLGMFWGWFLCVVSGACALDGDLAAAYEEISLLKQKLVELQGDLAQCVEGMWHVTHVAFQSTHHTTRAGIGVLIYLNSTRTTSAHTDGSSARSHLCAHTSTGTHSARQHVCVGTPATELRLTRVTPRFPYPRDRKS